MSQAPDASAPVAPDLLDRPEAGGKAIRGGAYRLLGFGAGILLSLASAPLLIRHLGVDDFGRYTTVLAVIAVVSLVADAGLTVVGLREFPTRPPGARERLIGSLVLMRLVTTGVAGLGAVGFVLLAGYDRVMVLGTVVGCAALLITMCQQTMTIPIQADLRFGVTSLLDLLRATLASLGAIVLVLAGARLLDFYLLLLPAAALVLAATLVVERRWRLLVPRVDRADLRYLWREAVPAATFSVLSAVFYKASIIVMSTVATQAAIGWFSASYRIVETVIVVPGLVVGTAFPIMARAAETDLERLRYILQRLLDVGLILGGASALLLGLGAPIAIALLAGPGFDPAVPALRVQGLALGVSFLIPTAAGALWVMRLRRQLIVGNVIGLACVVGFTFAGAHAGATQTAIGATTAEWAYAAALWTLLLRARPDLAVRLGTAWRVAVAVALGSCGWLLPGPAIAQLAGGAALFAVGLVVTRAVPPELVRALRARRDPLLPDA